MTPCLDNIPSEHGELLQLRQGLLFYSKELFFTETVFKHDNFGV